MLCVLVFGGAKVSRCRRDHTQCAPHIMRRVTHAKKMHARATLAVCGKSMQRTHGLSLNYPPRRRQRRCRRSVSCAWACVR